MEEKIFKTFIRNRHIWDENLDVRMSNRIEGMMLAICNPEADRGKKCIINRKYSGTILKFVTTSERYELFRNYVENWYPGLCIFNYSEESV